MSCGPQEGQQLEVRLLQRPGLSNGGAIREKRTRQTSPRAQGDLQEFHFRLEFWSVGGWE